MYLIMKNTSAKAQKFLDEVNSKFEALGHKAGFGWSSKGRRYHMHCTQCGVHVAVTVTTKLVTEFPERTCEEQNARVAAYRTREK